MNWIKKLFKYFSKLSTSHVKWDADVIPLDYTMAVFNAEIGKRVRHKSWPVGDYVEGVSHKLWRYSAEDGLTRRYHPTPAEQYGGMNWQIVGER